MINGFSRAPLTYAGAVLILATCLIILFTAAIPPQIAIPVVALILALVNYLFHHNIVQEIANGTAMSRLFVLLYLSVAIAVILRAVTTLLQW